MDSEFIKCRQSIRIEIPFKGALYEKAIFFTGFKYFFKFWLGVFEPDLLKINVHFLCTFFSVST